VKVKIAFPAETEKPYKKQTKNRKIIKSPK